MKLYLDDDTASPLLAKLLRNAGHDVQLPSDASISGKDDAVHLTHAIQQDRICLTRNHGDFENLHNLLLAAKGGHAGILVIRQDNDPTRDNCRMPDGRQILRTSRYRYACLADRMRLVVRSFMMASTTDSISLHAASVVARPIPLEAGDHLDQKSFHARYEAMPPDTRAELIGGVVYMMSPMKNPHGRHTRDVSFWLRTYELATPGVEGGDGLTTILGHNSEPQPDACLYIRPENGGRVRINADGYTVGAPELIVEVASSTESYELHSKKHDYESAGVCEYIVVALRQNQVFWFALRDTGYAPLQTGDDGIYRSEVFPGLWLDPQSLLDLDGLRIRAVLQQGLESPEHAKFARKLTTA